MHERCVGCSGLYMLMLTQYTNIQPSGDWLSSYLDQLAYILTQPWTPSPFLVNYIHTLHQHLHVLSKISRNSIVHPPDEKIIFTKEVNNLTQFLLLHKAARFDEIDLSYLLSIWEGTITGGSPARGEGVPDLQGGRVGGGGEKAMKRVW